MVYLLSLLVFGIVLTPVFIVAYLLAALPAILILWAMRVRPDIAFWNRVGTRIDEVFPVFLFLRERLPLPLAFVVVGVVSAGAAWLLHVSLSFL